jgi:hypothetical protein
MQNNKPFDINKWIYSAPEMPNEKVFNLGGAEIHIRRLNGLEWQEVANSTHLQTFLLLKYGLLNSETNEPFDVKLVREFCEKRPIAAGKISQEISELTAKSFQLEMDILEQAEKNSDATGESEHSENGVDSTVKTP